jgi:hypothetical protein
LLLKVRLQAAIVMLTRLSLVCIVPPTRCQKHEAINMWLSRDRDGDRMVRRLAEKYHRTERETAMDEAAIDSCLK